MTSGDGFLLRYCGGLGHTVVVIRGTGDKRSAGLETCDLTRARAYAADCSDEDEPSIYRRTKRGWSKVAWSRQNAR